MNKQIEEMAKEMCEDCAKDEEPCRVARSGNMCDSVREQAEHLYNAGYRKQVEVIDEFVKRLLDAFPEPHRGGNLCPAIYYDDYREIIEECGARMKGEKENV